MSEEDFQTKGKNKILEKNFPIQVFEDVKQCDFGKHNKKHVTEDFVVENFKAFGWRVYRPFNDTGIDMIATKFVCPNGHTDWNETIGSKCPVCDSKSIEITRFVQIKTREVKESGSNDKFFGYTLKPKDFKTDPRYVILLYSDFTNDFLIIPIFEYLKIFSENEDAGKTHFGTPSFRVGNNKLNNLKYDASGSWYWATKKEKISFDKFLNENGMQLISSPIYEREFNYFIDEISKMKIKLFYNYSAGRQFSKEKEEKINSILKQNIEDNLKIVKTVNGINVYKIALKRKEMRKKIKSKLAPELIKSIEDGYFSKFKGVSFNE